MDTRVPQAFASPAAVFPLAPCHVHGHLPASVRGSVCASLPFWELRVGVRSASLALCPHQSQVAPFGPRTASGDLLE